jgi:hypothetical protein
MYSAIDMFKFATSMYLYFKDSNIDQSVNPKIITLLKNIAKHSFKKLEEILDDDALNKKTYTFPNYDLLSTYFTEYEFNDKNNIEASSIFKLDNIKEKYDYFERNNEQGNDSNKKLCIDNNTKDLIKFINSQMENYNVTIMPDTLNMIDNTINLTNTED